MSRFLLDTVAWRRLVNGERLSPAAANELVDPDEPLSILDISIWEIAKAVEVGTLVLSLPVGEWLDGALAASNLEVLPIAREIAVRSCSLRAEGFPHRDPADQLITAAALVHSLTLATEDRNIRQWGRVPLLLI